MSSNSSTSSSSTQQGSINELAALAAMSPHQQLQLQLGQMVNSILQQQQNSLSNENNATNNGSESGSGGSDESLLYNSKSPLRLNMPSLLQHHNNQQSANSNNNSNNPAGRNGLFGTQQMMQLQQNKARLNAAAAFANSKPDHMMMKPNKLSDFLDEYGSSAHTRGLSSVQSSAAAVRMLMESEHLNNQRKMFAQADQEHQETENQTARYDIVALKLNKIWDVFTLGWIQIGKRQKSISLKLIMFKTCSYQNFGEKIYMKKKIFNRKFQNSGDDQIYDKFYDLLVQFLISVDLDIILSR